MSISEKIRNQLLILSLLMVLGCMTGCSSIFSKQVSQTVFYSLDGAKTKTQVDSVVQTTSTLPTLAVHIPKAAAGFDTRRMMYSRSQHQLEYFARSEWVDTPSHMLQPLMVSAIENTNSYSAVVAKLPAAKTDLKLESEILSLVQDFNTKPSTVRFTLRVTIINNATGKIVALREFDERVVAVSDDPVGGVKAANEAVNNVLEKLGTFSATTATNWKH
ncbi:MAG: ABC-type transport auxiliary lipoprotein family protein [Saprospiraceae bacterium]|nr:ABC-type transport auxiliary lipoprotein family protein [Saprospiraceae bacterium]